MNCRGDEDIDAKRSRPSIGKPVMGHARKERVVLFGTDQRITSGPAAKRPHSKAEYMTAPERFADSQIPLAPRAPSIHDPSVIQGATLPHCTAPFSRNVWQCATPGLRRAASVKLLSLMELLQKLDTHFESLISSIKAIPLNPSPSIALRSQQ